jgi:hypothetical protein
VIELASGSQFACETYLVQLYGLYLRLLTWIMCFLCSSQGVSRSLALPIELLRHAPPVLPCSLGQGPSFEDAAYLGYLRRKCVMFSSSSPHAVQFDLSTRLILCRYPLSEKCCMRSWAIRLAALLGSIVLLIVLRNFGDGVMSSILVSTCLPNLSSAPCVFFVMPPGFHVGVF